MGPSIRYYNSCCCPPGASWDRRTLVALRVPAAAQSDDTINGNCLPMTQITSHVLDTTLGLPAREILVTLMQQHDDDWLLLGSGTTNQDGRVLDFIGSDDVLPAGIYKLTFYLADYHAAMSQKSFYPQVDVTVEIEGNGQHYHVPLLLSPYSYSTYRGS